MVASFDGLICESYNFVNNTVLDKLAMASAFFMKMGHALSESALRQNGIFFYSWFVLAPGNLFLLRPPLLSVCVI